MDQPDEPTDDISDELSPSLSHLERKQQEVERLMDLLQILQREGADVYVDNPADSSMIHVIVKDDEPSSELAQLARMDSFLQGDSITRTEITYLYDDEKYEVNKKFRTDR